MTLREIAECLIWFPPMINIFALSCQVSLSARLRSVQGVSSYMLMLRYIAASVQILYLYFLQMPFGYRVMIIPQALLILAMMCQQVYYTKNRWSKWSFSGLWAMVVCGWLVAIWAGQYNPHFIGHAGGWLMAMIGTVTQLPQIVRNWRRKSVKGYSRPYVIFSICAYTFDLTLATILGVPIQTHITYIRAISYRCIELLQFHWYQKNSRAEATR